MPAPTTSTAKPHDLNAPAAGEGANPQLGDGSEPEKARAKDFAGIAKETQYRGAKLLGEFAVRNGATGSAIADAKGKKAEAEASYALAWAVNTGRITGDAANWFESLGTDGLQELVGKAVDAGVTTASAAGWLTDQHKRS